jgi:hypothetical protein
LKDFSGVNMPILALISPFSRQVDSLNNFFEMTISDLPANQVASISEEYWNSRPKAAILDSALDYV